jgi:hypothetical protein
MSSPKEVKKLTSADFPPEEIPDSQKILATEWRRNNREETFILPDLKHNSDYVEPLSGCSGEIRMRGFSIAQSGDVTGRCDKCKNQVTISRGSIIIAKGYL